ncbi:copper amine oxidase N-terminal domain-containing protein [Paenibacillus campinasensis]|uniref:Copper amine oxidase-like N-terminal domain-containing protein n=1 Tax=Paenibacillus campinasensis TaxID=66347 RepID=A0A268ELX4_9BACL|nr:copper amine oxidase N-terminal domain-containing protein [Paenibacillus campinasensis]PAD74117.1 hypothetical protein CHH67_18615 [Paenibacillus campinasensis]
MKKFFSSLLAMIMLFTFIPDPISAAGSLTATKTASKITVDGVVKSFDAYTIDGNNYFKLRDIAYILSGTTKQFDVTWDGGKNAISLLSGRPYTVIGGEMAMSTGGKTKSAILSTSKVYLDNKEITLAAYIIDGNNYFKLRDLGSTFDFYVEWDGKKNSIEIESMFSYIPENTGDSYSYRSDINLENTQKDYISNTASISPVQQFSYKNEGFAYAYVKDKSLIIVTPSKQLSVEMKYPILGDVISDDDGNIYVVWGKQNDSNGLINENVFISKYSPEGQHIKTTGFVGKSSPWGDSNAAKTKTPFSSGNSVSVIADGILVNYHSKLRYDGHQSDNAIAVRTSDMSVYQLPNDTFSGHSFNQSLIYSKLSSRILFASQGDAYPRGFRINNSNGKYGDSNEIVFHFYLEANANYDMSIVNKTFAQLGGLAETSKGVVLVGASAKSISEAAKMEKQNLFIQIFDPLAKELSPSTFVGGSSRSGATSFDINDNKNSPLTEVTDYGVVWLTNYTDKNVIAPQVVVADDRIVILWTEDSKPAPESFYMVLSAGGDVITPATSLGRIQLNSYEMPIYHNGLVYWAYTYNGKLRVVSIK